MGFFNYVGECLAKVFIGKEAYEKYQYHMSRREMAENHLRETDDPEERRKWKRRCQEEAQMAKQATRDGLSGRKQQVENWERNKREELMSKYEG